MPKILISEDLLSVRSITESCLSTYLKETYSDSVPTLLSALLSAFPDLHPDDDLSPNSERELETLLEYSSERLDELDETKPLSSVSLYFFMLWSLCWGQNRWIDGEMIDVEELTKALSAELHDQWANQALQELLEHQSFVALFKESLPVYPHKSDHNLRLIKHMLKSHLLTPSLFIHTQSLIDSLHEEPRGELQKDPRYVEFWIRLDAPSTLQSCELLVQRSDSSQIFELCDGLARALKVASQPEYYSDVEIRGLSQAFIERWGQEYYEVPVTDINPHQQRRFAEICLRTLQVAYTGKDLPKLTYLNPLFEYAGSKLSTLNRSLKEDEDFGEETLTHNSILYSSSYTLLKYERLTFWRVFKPLLIAFRELRVPAIPPDLSVLVSPVSNEDLPYPWFHLPALMMTRLYQEMGREPDLTGLRGHFAQYLLDRLKSRVKSNEPTDEEMIEPDPVWRTFYSLALSRLHVNPGGRGHKTLYWSTRFDPDAEVRQQSAQTYKLMRAQKGLPQNTSSRRVILEVLWYLRQAHLTSLGVEIDSTGAHTTLRKELRYNLGTL